MEKQDYAVAHMFFFAFKSNAKRGRAVIKNSRQTFLGRNKKRNAYLREKNLFNT